LPPNGDYLRAGVGQIGRVIAAVDDLGKAIGVAVVAAEDANFEHEKLLLGVTLSAAKGPLLSQWRGHWRGILPRRLVRMTRCNDKVLRQAIELLYKIIYLKDKAKGQRHAPQCFRFVRFTAGALAILYGGHGLA